MDLQKINGHPGAAPTRLKSGGAQAKRGQAGFDAGSVRAFLVALGVVGLLLGQASELLGQAGGRIVGQIVSAQTGQPLPAVQVILEGTSRATLTDPSGRYVLSGIPAGPQTIVAQSLGFARKTVTEVAVSEGSASTLDISLDTEAVELDEITVTAEREQGSTAVLLDRQRTAVAVLDAVGAQEISRSPDSDAAEVARRLSGTTVTEGKYVFVRGLGERYSQTSLNGSPLPSPEPEKEVVPLDLFPSGFLESLTTQKTYTPDLPADFTGGSVAIRTRDYPLNRSFKFSISSSYNSKSQFRDGYPSYSGGDLDFLGVDDGARDLPADVSTAIGGLRGGQSLRNVSRDARAELGPSFQQQFTPTESGTPLNRSISASYGQPLSLAGRAGGFFVGVNYSDKFGLRDEVERKFTTAAFNPDFGNGEPEANVDYTFHKGTREVQLGAVGNASLLITPGNKIRLATTFSRAAEDEARHYFGVNNEDLSGDVRGDRLRFVARTLYSGQLSGEHQTLFRSTLTWRAALARAQQEEPGLREAVYVRLFGSASNAPFYLRSGGESARYFYSDLVDDDLSGGVDWTLPLSVWGGGVGSLQVGASYRSRDRDFAARRFNWIFRQNTVTNLDSALNEGTFVGRVTQPGEFEINEIVEPGDLYTVDDQRQAAYAMVDLPLTRRLRLAGGARVEQYELDLQARGVTRADRSQTVFLPAANLVFSLTELMNLRAAYSQTLDRPEFRELSPFQFTEAASLRQVVGNPDLEVARFRNYDLRWEWFPRPNELLSLGAFYKTFTDPIEQVYFAAASTAYSYQNGVDGRLLGAEVDIIQGLDVIGGAFRDFFASGNLALIDSEVNVVESGAFVPTNAKRPLEGQSPFVANAGLAYRHPDGLREVGVLYNVFGKRLTAAGGSGVPDIYEMPRHQLDITYTHGLPNGLRLKFSAQNLLDASNRYEQSKDGITVVQREYSPGRTLSIGLSLGN